MPRPRSLAPRLLVFSLLSTALILSGCARRPQDPFASLRENRALAASEEQSERRDSADDLKSSVRNRKDSDVAARTVVGESEIQVTGATAEKSDSAASRQDMIDRFLADTLTDEPRSVVDRSTRGSRDRSTQTPPSRQTAAADPYVSPDLPKVSKLRQLMLEDPPAQDENPFAELEKSMAELDAQRSAAVPLLPDESRPMDDPFEVLRQLENETDSGTGFSASLGQQQSGNGDLSAPGRGAVSEFDFDRFLDRRPAATATEAAAEAVADTNPFATPASPAGSESAADADFLSRSSSPPTSSPSPGTAPALPDNLAATETGRLPEINAASTRVELLPAPAESSLQVTVSDNRTSRPSAADWGTNESDAQPPAPATPGQDPSLVVANFVGSDEQQRPIVRVEANRPVSIADPTQITAELDPQPESLDQDPGSAAEFVSEPEEPAERTWQLDGTRMEQLQAPMGPELSSPTQLAMAAPAPEPAAEPVNLATVRLDDIEFADPHLVQAAPERSHWWFVAGGLLGAVVIGMAVGRLRTRKSA